jgi:hypothetical protein
VYDRYWLRGLIVLPLLAAVVPFLSFTTTPTLVWAGALIWGIALGVHESTTRWRSSSRSRGPAARPTDPSPHLISTAHCHIIARPPYPTDFRRLLLLPPSVRGIGYGSPASNGGVGPWSSSAR